MERDSVSFDSAFNRKVEYEENEDQAVTRYLKNHPNTILSLLNLKEETRIAPRWACILKPERCIRNSMN